MFKFLLSTLLISTSLPVLAEKAPVISFSERLIPDVLDDKIINILRSPLTDELNFPHYNFSKTSSPIPFDSDSFIILRVDTLSWMYKSKSDLFIRLYTDMIDKNKNILRSKELIIHCPKVVSSFKNYSTKKHYWSDILSRKYIFPGKVYSDFFESDFSIHPYLENKDPINLLKTNLEMLCLNVDIIETKRATLKVRADFSEKSINDIWKNTQEDK